MKKYVCTICGFIYDEAAGIPAAGIKPGTSWGELPERWVCPLCGASKGDFKVDEALPEQDKRSQSRGAAGSPDGPRAENNDRLRELSPGELSAVCSNLARGCEKQYRMEEAGLFTKLAEYFKAKTPGAGTADTGLLLDGIDGDLTRGFPAANEAAADDRGARRALVWSEKVTRITGALLKRWETEGESMLEHTSIYVCDICGFIYVGDNPPDLCPVCKVPGWKFSRIERRG